MSKNKTWLVAHREYMENLRTKTFWIGIIFIPILIAVSIAVPAWLEKTKDIRKYAVIDHSEWLADAVKEHAALPDLQRVFDYALEEHEKGSEDFDELPAFIRAIATAIAGTEGVLDDEQLEVIREEHGEDADIATLMIGEISAQITKLNDPEGQSILGSGMIPAEARSEIEGQIDQIREWWKALPPDEAKQFGSKLSKSQYEQIPLPDKEGDDLFDELNAQINSEKLFAYFVIGEDPVAGNTGFRYVSNNLTDSDLKGWFEGHATDIVQEKRIDEEGIDPAVATKIREKIKFEGKKISEDGEEEEVKKEDTLRQFAPVAFVYLLWMAIFSITQMLLTNTIEEKSNRILEVLLSSISPLQLMMGKIAGIAMTGLTVVTSWVICFVVMVRYVPAMIGGNEGLDLTMIAEDPKFLASFLVYFFLGYLLLAAFLVGIGSVCNSIKEANNLMMPITVVLMVPLLAMIPIAKDPNGKLAMILSYIPPFTPFTMMNRAGGNIATWEYVVTTILLLVSIVAAMWAAAKVFRIGILMTGKAPTPMEIIRWIKTPVGHIPVQKEE